MSLLTECLENGFPDKLLIPIVPPFVSYKTRVKNEKTGEAVDGVVEADGKHPGVLYREGLWGAIRDWQDGDVDKAMRAKSDAAGCNIGLVLGTPSCEANGYSFIVVDVDLGENGDSTAQTILCDKIERALAAAYAGLTHEKQTERYVCWTRKTTPFRAQILCRIPGEASPGRKFRLEYYEVDAEGNHVLKETDATNPEKADKRKLKHAFEFLTKGQQTIIAGQHKSGVPIQWYRSDVPSELFTVPFISPESVPAFASYEDFVAVSSKVIKEVLEAKDCPILTLPVKTLSAVTPEYHASTGEASPSSVKAPSAKLLIQLIDLMPNPDYVNRDFYKNVMLAIAGARWGLLQCKELAVDEDTLIAEAAARWAARYEEGGDYDAELLKYESDWSRQAPYRIGWNSLQKMAKELGVDTAPITQLAAQDSFEAEEPPEPEVFPELTWDDEAKHLTSSKEELTEFWLATEFMKYANGRIKWLEEGQTWLSWQTSKGGWFMTNASNWVRQQLQLFLAQVVRNTGKITKDETNKILTSRMVLAVEKLIRDRSVQVRAELNDSPWALQTPEGAYDLKTGELIPPLLQRKNMDTRYTTCVPKEGPTGLWDSLIFHLANDDDATADWLKYYAAYALTGDPSAHKMLFIHGNGGNGKSTFLNVLAGIMGSYAGAIDRDVWLERAADKHPASLFRIRDVRLAYTSEMPDNETWNESRLKAVTGQDIIEAREMRGNPVPFRARAAVLMVGNAIPTFRKIDTSVTRRVAIIGTTRAPKNVIQKLSERIIQEEGPAILFDLIKRCQHLATLAEGLPETTPAMQLETKDYMDKSDIGYAWLTAECIIGADAENCITAISTLKDRFTAFLRRRNADNGGDVLGSMETVSEQEFGEAMRRAGVRNRGKNNELIMINGELAFEGIKLKVALAA